MRIINDFNGNYRFLSNYYSAMITDDYGISYPTTEHAFAAAKTLDEPTRWEISSLSTPGKAKRAGRRVALRPDWEDVKTDVMKSLVWQKFSQPQFRELLVNTGNSVLIEGNTWHDQFWGDCVCETHLQEDGRNTLGILLMMTRLYLT